MLSRLDNILYTVHVVARKMMITEWRAQIPSTCGWIFIRISSAVGLCQHQRSIKFNGMCRKVPKVWKEILFHAIKKRFYLHRDSSNGINCYFKFQQWKMLNVIFRVDFMYRISCFTIFYQIEQKLRIQIAIEYRPETIVTILWLTRPFLSHNNTHAHRNLFRNVKLTAWMHRTSWT